MPAHIEAVPHEDGTAYQIISQSLDEVWAEIARLMSDDHGGAEFEKPHRAYSIEDGLKRWRARGIVKPLTPTAEACADVRAWQRSRAGA
jgi:hypothetical protein